MRNVGVFFTVRVSRFIPKRSERKGSIVIIPLPSESRKRKVKDPAPGGGEGGRASYFQGLPWGIDTFHCPWAPEE